MQTKCSYCACIYCLRKSCLSMVLLVFSKHIIIGSSWPDKGHFSHVADDTDSPHLNKQQTQVREQALHDSCTESTRKGPSSSTKHQHREVTVVANLQLHQGKCTSYYLQPDVLTYICSKDTQTQHCVSKYHSARLVNSQVYTLQTEPDARQTGLGTGSSVSV